MQSVSNEGPSIDTLFAARTMAAVVGCVRIGHARTLGLASASCYRVCSMWYVALLGRAPVMFASDGPKRLSASTFASTTAIRGAPAEMRCVTDSGALMD